MQKYVFVKLLGKPPEDGVFHMKDWPLHVTVVPNFSINMPEREVFELVSKLVKEASVLSVVAASDEMFGPSHDLRVTLLDMTPELKSLHKNIYNQLVSRGAVFDQPQYCDDNYRAHATVQKTGRLQRGEKVMIDELVFVDMFHDGDIRQRRIIDTIKLKN